MVLERLLCARRVFLIQNFEFLSPPKVTGPRALHQLTLLSDRVYSYCSCKVTILVRIEIIDIKQRS